MSFRRINFIGGPGCGKTTLASRIFSELKLRNVTAGLVFEAAKEYAIQAIPIKQWDQVFLLGEQIKRETRFLDNGYAVILTDSPLSLNYTYSKQWFGKDALALEGIKHLIWKYEEEYPSINFFLDWDSTYYEPVGRYQSASEAEQLHKQTQHDFIECFAHWEGLIPEYDTLNRINAVDTVLDNLKKLKVWG